MNILLVGGAGFIGVATARALAAAGHAVRVADTAVRLQRLVPGLAMSAMELDFSRQSPSPALLSEVDALIHLGCTSNPAKSMASMEADADANIGPSIRLFERAQQAGVPRIIFASSGGTVYGIPQQVPVSELAATDPISAYGVSKLAIEKYLALVPGVIGVSLRVANPYGADQLNGAAVGVIARYLAATQRGESLEVWGDGSVVRDYIAVEDVASAFVAAACTDLIAPGVYNIGSGRGTSVSEIIRMVFDATGAKVPVLHHPSRGYDVPAIVLDSGKFRGATGWVPCIDLPRGIEGLYRASLQHILAGVR